MTTKTKLEPLNIGIRDNQLLVDENGDKFVDLLSDLGWDYQSMTSSGRETYDKLMQMLGIIEPDEVYMEIQMDSKSFTFYSHNSMKDELVNLTENQLQELRAFYVERFVDNMDTKDLVQYVMDDMMGYMEALPDNEVIDECVNYWDDHFEDVVEEIKEYTDCDFKKPVEERFNK